MTSASGPSDNQSLWRRWLLIAAVLLSYCTAGFFTYQNGLSAFQWDDSEYLYQAVDTFDHLTSFGSISWPGFIVAKQHYGKPPLYVNVLTACLSVTGRQNATAAVALLAYITGILLAVAVYVLVRKVFAARYGFLAIIAMAGLPCISRWLPLAYPDALLTVLILVVLASIFNPNGKDWLVWRTLFLGLTLGLGMLAKATFPAFVALPLIYWFWHGSPGGPTRLKRLKILLFAATIGAAVAAIWYLPNAREAVGYVRASYAFTIQPNTAFTQRLRDWLVVLASSGIGSVLLGGSTLVFCFTQFSRPQRHKDATIFGSIIIPILLGSLPAIFVALSSPVPPNTRHLLPSLVLLALGILLALFQEIEASHYRNTLFAVVFILLGVQWILTLIAAVPGGSDRLYRSPLAQELTWLVPSATELQPVSAAPVKAVIEQVEAVGETAPPVWYLSGNDAALNIPRLQLAAKLSYLPVRFEYATYFSWPVEQCLSILHTAQANPSMVIVMNHSSPGLDKTTQYLNRYNKLAATFLNEATNSFQKINSVAHSNYNLVFYFNTLSAMASIMEARHIYANFGNKILITRAKVDDAKLLLRITLRTQTKVNYKLLVHGRPIAADRDRTPHIWDQYIRPPLTSWQAGETRVLAIPLPSEYTNGHYDIEIGFFDEADVARGWPPLPLTNGKSVFTLTAEEPGVRAKDPRP